MSDIESHVDALTRVVRQIVGKRPIAMFDCPAHANTGDHFIWLGEKVLFKYLLKNEIVYECSLQHVDVLRLTRLPAETVFIMHGGGNFGDLYRHHERLREAIIAAFPDRSILIMPQTIFFQNRENVEHPARCLRSHPDLHVLARDRESLAALQSGMGLPNCHLGIDSAFFLRDIVRDVAKSLSIQPKYEKLYLIRRDIESRLNPHSEADVPRYDWAAPDDLAAFVGIEPTIGAIDIARDAFGGDFDSYSWRLVCAAIRLFSESRRIVTDRLHGHILAVMMGKPHVLHDNSYGKNAAFCTTWTAEHELLTFVGADGPGLGATRPAIDQGAAAWTGTKVTPEPSRVERKRLAIIIPYRDRPNHIAKLLPHLISYLHRQPRADIRGARIVVVEQADDLPFNRGALLNAGFRAVEHDTDYVCFHDVDYIPMWADYTYAETPTRIVWWGMNTRPIRLADPSRQTQAPRDGLGAVSLFPTELFRALNGYSNRYQGWGFEDKDIAAKCTLHGAAIAQRDGTFIPLDHDNAGYQDDGSKSPAWIANEARFIENQGDYTLRGTGAEGLSTLAAATAQEIIRVTGLDAAEAADILLLGLSLDPEAAAPDPARIAATAALLRALRPAHAPTVIVPGAAETLRRAPKPALPLRPTRATPVPRRQTIALAMIVKNEAPVIARCLASVRPLLDHWIVVDTGSTDGTQAIVQQSLPGIPGALHERPWVDFAHNRTQALELARPHADYTLVIDADDVLDIPPGFRLPVLTEDIISLEIRHQERRYWRLQLVRNTEPWRYEGVLHEFLSLPGAAGAPRILPEQRTQRRLPGLKIVMSDDGARRRTAAALRYRDDAALLEAALRTETDPFLIARYNLYLGESLRDAGESLPTKHAPASAFGTRRSSSPCSAPPLYAPISATTTRR